MSEQHSAENDARSQEELRYLRDRAAVLLHEEICDCEKGYRAHGRAYIEMAGTVVRAILPLISRDIPPAPSKGGSDA